MLGTGTLAVDLAVIMLFTGADVHFTLYVNICILTYLFIHNMQVWPHEFYRLASPKRKSPSRPVRTHTQLHTAAPPANIVCLLRK